MNVSSTTASRISEYRHRDGEFGTQPHAESGMFDDAGLDPATARPAARLFLGAVARNPLAKDLQREWHPTRNGSLHADMASAGAGRRVWWQCAVGHEWEAEVKDRTRGNDCPFCGGRREPLAPQLIAEWHPTRNTLKLDRVTPGSIKKAWWVCAAGHEWQALILSRSKGVGCPTCEGRLVPLSPGLIAEWHPTRNYDVSPDRVTAGSTVKVWWRCAAGHDWQAPVYSRARTDGTGRGCPVCYGRVAEPGVNDLATVDPVLSADWHPTLNGTLTPRDVLPKSQKRVWWQCRLGHEWQATVFERTIGSRCQGCFGSIALPGVTDAGTLHPELVAEWHPSLNEGLTLNLLLPGSAKIAWWRCSAGHEWTAEVRSRCLGRGCPTCAGRRKPGRPRSA